MRSTIHLGRGTRSLAALALICCAFGAGLLFSHSAASAPEVGAGRTAAGDHAPGAAFATSDPFIRTEVPEVPAAVAVTAAASTTPGATAPAPSTTLRPPPLESAVIWPVDVRDIPDSALERLLNRLGQKEMKQVEENRLLGRPDRVSLPPVDPGALQKGLVRPLGPERIIQDDPWAFPPEVWRQIAKRAAAKEKATSLPLGGGR